MKAGSSSNSLYERTCTWRSFVPRYDLQYLICSDSARFAFTTARSGGPVASANPKEAYRSGSSRALVNDRSWRCADHTDTPPITFEVIASVCLSVSPHFGSDRLTGRRIRWGQEKCHADANPSIAERVVSPSSARYCLRLRANQQPRTAPLEISFADVNPNVNVKSNSITTTTTTTKSLSNRSKMPTRGTLPVTFQACCHINS
jgi:hypothetical protein